MNDDDIILQPDVPKTEDVKEEIGKTGDNGRAIPPEPATEDVSSPRIFDFSSDFNISPVSDEAPAQNSDVKTGSLGALPSGKSINLITKDKPAVPVTPATPAAKPSAPTQYREKAEPSQNWPFAFGKQSSPSQPIMNPSANAASNAQPQTSAPGIASKNAPSSQPVKTIRSEGGSQTSDKELQRPKTDLQRDVLAILPNMKKGGTQSAPGVPSAPQKNPMFSPQGDSDLKPLRTYESDVAEVLSHRKTSTASIAIAENKKKTGEERLGTRIEAPANETPKIPRQTPRPQPRSADVPVPKRILEAAQPISRESAFRQDSFPQAPDINETFRGGVVTPTEVAAPKAPSHLWRNLSLSLLSLVIVVGGIFGGYYLYMKSPLSISEPKQPQTSDKNIPSKSLVLSDSQVLIPTDGQSAQNILALVRSEIEKPQNPNTVKDIVLTRTVSGVKSQVSPADVARALNIPVPNVVLRTIQPQWMLGVYADASGTKNIFIAAITDNFQNALSGMLGWEASLPRDLNTYINNGTSTLIQGRFIDEIVKNKDVRSFVAPGDEKTIFLYSFVSNSMLVVSDSEIALAEIVIRLENQAFVR